MSNFTANAFAQEPSLQRFVEQQIRHSAEQQKDVPARGLLALKNGELLFSVTVGYRSKDDQQPFGAHTPVRIASNTKTYVAAAVFKLIEQGKLSLHQPIKALLPPNINAMLMKGGYPTSRISAGHLLAHTSGMHDHTRQAAFLDAIVKHPDYQWQPEQHIQAMLEIGPPLAMPGEKYQYSDTGYIVLGQMIEHVMDMHLSDAVHTLLQLKQKGMNHTWWERFDNKPDIALDRAHQYLSGMDTFDWDPSIDLYGGGGLISSLYDMALFTDSLFDGAYFEKTDTLKMMTAEGDLPAPEQYLYGLTVSELAGEKAIGHSGFWGTVSLYFPHLDLTIAGIVTAQNGYKTMLADIEEVIRYLKQQDG